MSAADTALSAPPEAEASMPSVWLLVVIAMATGALAANLYYAQPLLALIGPDIAVRPDLAGSLVSTTQLGYAVGLLLLVSLADLVENKLLVLSAISATALGLVAAAVSSSAPMLYVASFVVGVSSTGAQVLVPFVAHLVPAQRRGRVVGNVMAGLLTGILLARPMSLFVAGLLGWRAVFWMAAALMVVIGSLIAKMMPRHQPQAGLSYGGILRSMVGLVKSLPILRRRAAYQALMFMAFNLFWTAAPLMLGQRFGLNETGIGLFALAGAGGALAAPLAGRLADRGLTWVATLSGMLVVTLAFVGTGWVTAVGAFIVLVVLTVLIDGGVQLNQIVSQRIIFTLAPEVRGRLNSIYMTTAFVGGAIGSILATASYHWGGWTATAACGFAIGFVALALFLTEKRSD